MPLDLNMDSFRLESSLDMPADGFTAIVSSSEAFRNAADTDRVTLNAGFFDDNGNQVMIAKLIDGIIDEYSLSLSHNQLKVNLRGRDAVANLLDKDIRRRYIRVPDPTAASGGPLFPNYYTVSVGNFHASQIAQQIATDLGLTLVWQIPRDYLLTTNFDAVGQAFELIRQLAEPYSHVEPFKVDIFADGTSIYVRQRNGFSMIPDYTYEVTDARILSIDIKRRVLPRFHRITITGRGGPDVTAHTIVINVTESIGYDNDGSIVSREVSSTSTLMPESIHLSTTTTTSDNIGVIKREELTKYYADGSLIAQSIGHWPSQTNQTIQQPMEVAEITLIFEADEDNVMRQTRKVEKTTSYDNELFVTLVSNSEYQLNEETSAFDKVGVSTENHFQVTPLMSQVIVANYSRDTETGALTLTDRRSSQAGGFRPGGRRPPPAKNNGVAYTKDIIVSTDVRAHDFSYSNDHLLKADVDSIFTQISQASGAQEFEIDFIVVGMPWLKKGAIIQLNGIIFEDGLTYTVTPALVISESTDYDESRERAQLVSQFKAIFWRVGS